MISKDENKSNKKNELDKNLDNINNEPDKTILCHISHNVKNASSNYIKEKLVWIFKKKQLKLK